MKVDFSLLGFSYVASRDIPTLIIHIPTFDNNNTHTYF